MKKICLVIITGLLFNITCFCQVGITNRTNTTPNLAATYPTLASAITALNAITAISGPVTITLNAANPQTAPSGGYAIQFAAATSAANNITIEGSNNVITAFAPQTTGNLNDAIFKLIGADYITIRDFTMQENAANTNNTAASNNMTEWGVALLRASLTDGAQNNTIQNNTISLNITYRSTFGIYSNARHSATAPTTVTDATAATGSNSGNRIYGNSISNVLMGITFIGTSTFQDSGNDIGGTSAATGNTITNWGGNTPGSSYASNSGTSYCIFANHQAADNISYNTLNSGTVGAGVSTSFTGIRKDYTAAAPSGTFTSTITYNTITMSSAFTGGNFEGIRSQGMALATGTMNISNNNIVNTAVIATSTSAFVGIISNSACGTLNIINNIIRGHTTVSSSGYTGISNSGAVENIINITGNKLGDAIAGALTQTTATTAQLNGIVNSGAASTATVNLNNNSLDGFSVVNYGQVSFVQNSTANPVAVNINNNQLGTATGSLISFSGVQASTLNGITIPNGNTSMAVSIQHNNITGIVNTVTGTGANQYIISQAPALSSNISNNTFTNLSANSSGTVFMVYKGGVMASGANSIIDNNSIVGTFNKTATGGIFYACYAISASPGGVTISMSGNNFSNITLTGSTPFYGVTNEEGASAVNAPTKTITGNIISNVTLGSGPFYGLYTNFGVSTNLSSNTLSNITNAGALFGLYYGGSFGGGTHTCSLNSISLLVSTGTSGFVEGIWSSNAATATWNINNNTITGLSSTGSGVLIGGIDIKGGNTVNVYDNQVTNLSGSGGGGTAAVGILVYNGTTVNLYRNNIHSLSLAAVTPGVSTRVINGIYINGGTNCSIYNNFISNLTTPNLNAINAIAGIEINSVTASTSYNLYYNSIYLNASSTGTNFGTYGVYAYTSATATSGSLNMINNIIANTSTPNGTGVTTAYGRSGTTLTNYATSSDYNLFYAGTPSATRLIFYDGTNSDQTLSAYQTRVGARDANSISVLPFFISATNLHLSPGSNCQIDGRGIPVPGITTDIDAQIRNATTPDIGADEFTAAGILEEYLATGVGTCESRHVSPTGTTYRSAPGCFLIASVLPSGADPVSGSVKTCVTLDATQQYFNGEPYVQRHFDIEPATGNQTTTSATITLYFEDSEFELYNTNNPALPKLPTDAGGGDSDPNKANLKITQFHGPASTSPSSPGNYPGVRELIDPVDANINYIMLGTGYWSVTFNVTGFSGFYVHTNNFNAALPITVNYLNGRKQGSNHLLDWKITCVSTPRATMTLERSSDARNYTGLYSITADAARCNQPFDHADTDPLQGMNYYRLKIVDADGKLTYSSTVALLNAAKGFDIISIAPNPVVADHFKLNVASARPGKMDMMIFDMQGRMVSRQSLTLIAGFNSLPVNISHLAAGSYTISAGMNNERSAILRFVKQ